MWVMRDLVDALLGKKLVTDSTRATLKKFADRRECVHEERRESYRQEEREHELRKLAQEGGEGSA